MIELLSSVDRKKRNRIVDGNKPGNATLNRRVRPNGRSYVCRMGYNVASCSYTESCEMGRLGGSSLNRMDAKRRKHEREEIYKEAEKKAQMASPSTYDGQIYAARLELLRNVKASEQRYKSKLSRSLDRGRVQIHVLSKRSKGKVRDKCAAFYRAMGNNKTFATLTFIDAVEDRAAQSILNKFLTQLRDDYGNLEYVWIAERQLKNTMYPGNIHFHIIFNRRLTVARYNALWVRQQYNHGLRFRDITPSEIDRRISDGSLKKILNPFDVKRITNIYGLSYYLTKYITKNKSEGFKCSAWHCSRGVSRLFTRTIVSRSTFADLGKPKNSRVVPSTGELKQGKCLHGPFFSLYFIENKMYFLPDMSELEAVNGWILEGMLPDRLPEVDEFDITRFYNN